MDVADRTLRLQLLLIHRVQNMLKALTGVGIGLALFDVDVAAVGRHGRHIVADEPSGSQHVDTAALIPALVYRRTSTGL